ncbi:MULTISPECIES: hypothetical protein [Xanthomonas]|uniref:hypothetical protein n=1 Tax=Xanthomonas TaxID=338 RepID=UPI00123E1C4C|nr:MULTISPECIES: hypothetical protein [Xanthomonas]MCW0371302.1 hypothetical protein [Xanthomonas sacchari]
MYNTTDKSRDLLFSTHSLDLMLRNTMEAMLREIEALDANRLLNTAPEDLKDYLIERHGVTPISLLRDQWHADHQEVLVDVRHDQRRWIDDRNQPAMVAGERFEVRIPFEGEAELFYARANTFNMNPPRATIDKNELVLRYDSPADQPLNIRPLVDRALMDIEQHLHWQHGMIDAHNKALPHAADKAIQQRRARLLAQSARADALGIPIKRRDDAPKTYAIPAVKRRAAPILPPATTAQFRPEPTWAMEQYEQALKIMQDMALVMERSPKAFKSMNEEALRQHFLVQLNGQFEGRATGETFNMEGKTDILLREGDRNVFIAECKFWKGPKVFSAALDQLMGYATWRDGKTAILVFNRGTDTSTVLTGIDAAAKAHPNFKRPLNWPHESGFRYIFHSNEDSNREITLTVLVFHVPT